MVEDSLFVSSMLWLLYYKEFKWPGELEQWEKLLLLIETVKGSK